MMELVQRSLPTIYLSISLSIYISICMSGCWTWASRLGAGGRPGPGLLRPIKEFIILSFLSEANSTDYFPQSVRSSDHLLKIRSISRSDLFLTPFTQSSPSYAISVGQTVLIVTCLAGERIDRNFFFIKKQIFFIVLTS